MYLCQVFWGTHGCHLPRGHATEEKHKCWCCECEDHVNNPEDGCVGSWPYYGESTRFYGEDSQQGY